MKLRDKSKRWTRLQVSGITAVLPFADVITRLGPVARCDPDKVQTGEMLAIVAFPKIP